MRPCSLPARSRAPVARTLAFATLAFAALALVPASPAHARTAKPPLYGQDWVAITGKPLAATAGAKIF